MTQDIQTLSKSPASIGSGISVIMVSWNSGPSVLSSLRQVLSQPSVGEVLLVDNGNSATLMESLRALSAEQPRLKILTGHGNVGFASGANLGVAQASEPLVCLIQADVFLEEDTLPLLKAALESHAGESIVSAMPLNPDGSEQKGGRMALMTPTNALTEAARLYKFNNTSPRVYLHTTQAPSQITEVGAVGFICVLTRRETYQRLGGLDGQFFSQFADLDFAQRAQKAGVARLFVPAAKVVHLRRTSRAGVVEYEWKRRASFQRYMQVHAPGISTPMHLGLQALTILWLALKLIRVRVASYLPESSGVKAARRVALLYRYLQEPVAEQTLSGQTILLTGATNQVGVCVLGRLLAQGAEVLAVTHQTEVPFRHKRLHWVQGDLRQGKLDVAPHRPTLLIHAAELWLLPPAMPAIAGSSITRVIAFGSAKVFSKVYADHSGEQAEIERLEQAEINAVKACRQNGIRWTIFRPTMIYGVGLDRTVMRIADAARRFGCVIIDPPAKGRRQPVHADDLAQAVLSAIAEKKCLDKAYNLSGGEVLEYRSMIERVMAALGQRPRLIELPFLPDWLDKIGRALGKPDLHGEHLRQMNQDMTMSYGEARADFGYLPRAFLSGGASDLGQY